MQVGCLILLDGGPTGICIVLWTVLLQVGCLILLDGGPTGICIVLWTVLLQVGCLILLDGGPGYFHSQFNQGIQAASKEEVRLYHKLVQIS